MAISPHLAIKAYQNAPSGGAVSPAAPAKPKTDFADVLKQTIRESIDTQKEGERLSLAAAAGTANLTDVITAVAEAEVTLQTVTSVRDKVVEAYREILRMQI